MNLRQPIEEMTVAHLFNPGEPPRPITAREYYLDEGSDTPEALWNTRIRDRMRALADRTIARSDVVRGQNRFRMVYGACASFEETQAGVDCPHQCTPHFHRRVRRIGHLPMFTIKELPT